VVSFPVPAGASPARDWNASMNVHHADPGDQSHRPAGWFLRRPSTAIWNWDFPELLVADRPQLVITATILSIQKGVLILLQPYSGLSWKCGSPNPDGERIGRLMRRYVRVVAFQGCMQVPHHSHCNGALRDRTFRIAPQYRRPVSNSSNAILRSAQRARLEGMLRQAPVRHSAPRNPRCPRGRPWRSSPA